jgi:hypothetical protein
MLQKLWLNIFRQTFQKTEQEKNSNSEFDFKVFIIFVTVAISLVMIQYLGDFNFLKNGLKSWGLDKAARWLVDLKESFNNNQLFYLTYWVFILFVFYLVLPLLIIKLVLKEKFNNYGLSPNGVLKSYKVYVLFFLFMFPLVILVSFTDSFQHKYPFYDPTGESLWPGFNSFVLSFFSEDLWFMG